MDESKLTFFTVEKMITPKDGYICYLNRYWCLSEDGKIMKYKNFSWQCNSQESCAQYLADHVYNGKILFLPVAYVPND